MGDSANMLCTRPYFPRLASLDVLQLWSQLLWLYTQRAPLNSLIVIHEYVCPYKPFLLL